MREHPDTMIAYRLDTLQPCNLATVQPCHLATLSFYHLEKPSSPLPAIFLPLDTIDQIPELRMVFPAFRHIVVTPN